MLEARLREGSYLTTALVSIFLHAGLLIAATFLPGLFGVQATIVLGTGPGGGRGGEIYSVGLVDDLGGGFGMYKPSLRPQPPAVPVERPAPEPETKAVSLPEREPKKRPTKKGREPEVAPAVPPNYVPVESGPGRGGSGAGGGSGGGLGGGHGVSIGSGSGGLGDSWYAQQVEKRISSNWLRSLIGELPGRHETVVSFYIRDNGMIVDLKVEKSSGISALDLSATRAVEASNPLAPPPPELRGRRVKFVAHFEYPPPGLR